MTQKEISKKYVTRSRFQKEVEKNKKLMADIWLLIQPLGKHTPDKIFLMEKWRKEFAKEADMHRILKEIATEYFKNNPDKRIGAVAG